MNGYKQSMAITAEHYNELHTGIVDYVECQGGTYNIGAGKTAKTETGALWAAYWHVFGFRCRRINKDSFRYADYKDAHIETAVKAIFNNLGIK